MKISSSSSGATGGWLFVISVTSRAASRRITTLTAAAFCRVTHGVLQEVLEPGAQHLLNSGHLLDLDANKAGQAIDCPVGTRCSDIGEKKFHATCKATKALREQTGIREVAYIEHMGIVMDSYWIPLAGSEEIYLHFGVDIT